MSGISILGLFKSCKDYKQATATEIDFLKHKIDNFSKKFQVLMKL